MVSLVFLGCMCLPGQADALFGWGPKTREMNSQKEKASSTRTSKNMRQRFLSSVQRNVNPCWAPSCTSEAAIERCARAKGLVLADFMKTAENFFITTGPDKKFVYTKVRLKDIDMAGWKAAYFQYKTAQKQFEEIIKKQGDISGLILGARPGNEDDQVQIEGEQIKLQEMQQHYIQFLAQSGLLDIVKFMAEQESLQQAMDVTGGSASIPFPPPTEPKSTDPKFARWFEATVRVINEKVRDAVKEFLTEQEDCFKEYCNQNCRANNGSYTVEDTQDLEDPDAIVTQSTVDAVRARNLIIKSNRCSGEDVAASRQRVLCTICKNAIKGREMIPACQVAEGEWGKQETAKANSLSGGIF